MKIFSYKMKGQISLKELFSQKSFTEDEKKELDNEEYHYDETRLVCGWIEQIRKQAYCTFVDITDGTCHETLQIVFDKKKENEMSEDYKKILEIATKGASLSVSGKIVKSQGTQEFEMIPENVKLYGLIDDPSTYPISKNKLSLEYLRKLPHLRIRTKTSSIIARIRSTCAYKTHQFYRDKGFQYIHTPCITSTDCEGAGEAFRVTSLKPGESDISKDFFGKEVSLTVSGQLNVETYIQLSKVYTFGPTFRAEESNTSRHLAEFWMVEPEIAFADLDDVVDLATSYLKYCTQAILEEHAVELSFLDKNVSPGLIKRLTIIAYEYFKRITYTEAIDILIKDIKDRKIIIGIPAKIQKSQKHKTFFEYDIEWGVDLASEAEKYLTTKFGKPVIVTNYPKSIKAFYMKEDEPGSGTVQAMDILIPGIGEIIGGSTREDDYDKLLTRIKEQGISEVSMKEYLDMRRYGTVPHGGFGLGFERLIMMVTGMTNIKDVIPFPRYHNHCEF